MSDEESELVGYDTSIHDPGEEEIAEARARYERMSDEEKAEWTAFGEALCDVFEHENRLAAIFKDFPVEQSSRDIRIPLPAFRKRPRP